MVTHDQRVIYKVNQDRGLISHPSLNEARHTIFGVFDGESGRETGDKRRMGIAGEAAGGHERSIYRRGGGLLSIRGRHTVPGERRKERHRAGPMTRLKDAKRPVGWSRRDNSKGDLELS